MGVRSQALRSAAAVATLPGGGYTVAALINGSPGPSAPPPYGSAGAPTQADTSAKGHHHAGRQPTGHDHSHAHAARGDGTSATPTGGTTAAVLGGEVAAPGTAGLRPLPKPDTVVEVDGYAVRLVEDALVAGYSTQLRVTMSGPDGVRAELRPYLASWAHAALVNVDSLAVSHLFTVRAVA